MTTGLFGKLLPQHRIEVCGKSGVDETVAEERGYQTIVTGRELLDLGYSQGQVGSGQARLPGWAAPLHKVDGTIGGWTYRADNPPTTGLKYLNPTGSRNVLDVHPRSQPAMKDPSIEKWITEGVKKGDCLVSHGEAAIALSGVDNWRGRNAVAGTTALGDWDDIAIRGCTFNIVFDADVKPIAKQRTYMAKVKLSSYLDSKGATVRWANLPEDPTGQFKTGVDDYLLTHTIDDLRATLTNLPTIPRAGRFPTPDDYENVLDVLQYQFRFNEVTVTVEVNGERYTDPMEAGILSSLGNLGFTSYQMVRTAALNLAFKNRYHPVREYLESLEWDGTERIVQLARYFRSDGGIFGKYLRLWLVGAVARAFESTQNRMLVLIAPQGTGKSQFARWLCSPLPQYHEESPIKPDDKDYVVKLAKAWIWEVGELGSTTRRADRDALKQFLTQETVHVRRAYDRYETTQPAMASFIGTINDEGGGFLSDPTGYRRYLVANVSHIDWRYAEMDVDQVWAEALALYRGGTRWQPSSLEEYRRIETRNAQFETERPLDVWVHDAVEKRRGEFLPTARIIEALQAAGHRRTSHDNLLAQEIAVVMTRMGFTKKFKRIGDMNVRGWVDAGLKGTIGLDVVLGEDRQNGKGDQVNF